MKGNTKKIAVLVMIGALAIVLPVAMVWADDHAGKKFIQGTYAVTGMNGVLLAPFGFDPQTFEPINGVAFPVGPQSWKGTYSCRFMGEFRYFSARIVEERGGLGKMITWSALQSDRNATTQRRDAKTRRESEPEKQVNLFSAFLCVSASPR